MSVIRSRMKKAHAFQAIVIPSLLLRARGTEKRALAATLLGPIPSYSSLEGCGQVSAAQACSQFRGSADAHDPSAVENRQPVAHLFGLGQTVGDEQYSFVQ